MLNIAMRMVNNYAEAQDVLQEAFVKAFRNLHTFKGDSTFGAWLKRIVVNMSINHLKKRKIQWVSMDTMYSDIAERSDSPPPQESAWNMEQIRRAIMKLPDGYRMVLSLYLLEGYDHKEIAHILGISEATSKSQYSRAKRKLKNMLKAM